MIANVTWYLGGNENANITVDEFYTSERGTTVYTGRATTSTGYVGLMYLSDFGYASLASDCARTTIMSSYGKLECGNWMYGSTYEWVINPVSTVSNRIFHHPCNNAFSIRSPRNGYGVRPVLYLDSTVYKISGNGTMDSPYLIGM